MNRKAVLIRQADLLGVQRHHGPSGQWGGQDANGGKQLLAEGDPLSSRRTPSPHTRPRASCPRGASSPCLGSRHLHTPVPCPAHLLGGHLELSVLNIWSVCSLQETTGAGSRRLLLERGGLVLLLTSQGGKAPWRLQGLGSGSSALQILRSFASPPPQLDVEVPTPQGEDVRGWPLGGGEA